jgi:hypothetical protein
MLFELGPFALLRSEQLSIPPANASVGGVSYSSLDAQRIPPLEGKGGIVVTGISTSDLTFPTNTWPTLEITVAPTALTPESHSVEFDLEGSYEELRRQMASEGVPFLDADELEREIADRKGTRS